MSAAVHRRRSQGHARRVGAQEPSARTKPNRQAVMVAPTKLAARLLIAIYAMPSPPKFQSQRPITDSLALVLGFVDHFAS